MAKDEYQKNVLSKSFFGFLFFKKSKIFELKWELKNVEGVIFYALRSSIDYWSANRKAKIHPLKAFFSFAEKIVNGWPLDPS